MLVLKNCKFVPFLTEGVDFEAGDVLVENGKIQKILPAGSEHPEGADVFNLAGKTLLPGLIDLHVHLFYETMNDIFVGNAAPQPTTALNAYRYAEELLNDGYTTVRDVGDLHPVSGDVAEVKLPDRRGIERLHPVEEEVVELL